MANDARSQALVNRVRKAKANTKALQQKQDFTKAVIAQRAINRR